MINFWHSIYMQMINLVAVTSCLVQWMNFQVVSERTKDEEMNRRRISVIFGFRWMQCSDILHSMCEWNNISCTQTKNFNYENEKGKTQKSYHNPKWIYHSQVVRNENSKWKCQIIFWNWRDKKSVRWNRMLALKSVSF